jgi:hypothetical protein
MRILMIPLAVMAISAVAPSTAMADPPGDRSHDNRGNGAHDNRGNDNRGNDNRGNDNRGNDNRGHDDRRDNNRNGYDRGHDNRQVQREYRNDARDWNRGRNYSYNRPDPRYGGYYADNYYRGGGNYRPLRLGSNDRIYRGRDNRYYCRRSDGTTGLIIGGLTGGVLGNAIAPGGSRTLGTLLGGGIGALLGQSIDRNSIVCR